MHAAPLEGFGPLRIVVSHEDVTAERHASSALAELERELIMQKSNLQTVNTALNVILKRREDDRKELEQNILSNIRELVTPYMEKLRKTNLDSAQREYLSIIQANIEGVTAPFAHHLSSKSFNFSSREISVANLILEGRATKEIADILCISTNAVEFHRKGIRRKLGIRNKKVNLRTRLLALEPGCLYQQFHAWNNHKVSSEDKP
jgi:DNA-binding CsgD family transcriptional regulator